MKNKKLMWGGKQNTTIPKLFGESLELTTIVVSGPRKFFYTNT